MARFQAIYEAMEHHHGWLTGPEDFPACAMLIGRAEESVSIGVGTDAVFQALLRRSGLLAWPAAKIVAVVLEFQGRLRGVVRWLGEAEALSLASSLTFIRLAGGDGTLNSLADAELLQGMQAIVVANSAG